MIVSVADPMKKLASIHERKDAVRGRGARLAARSSQRAQFRCPVAFHTARAETGAAAFEMFPRILAVKNDRNDGLFPRGHAGIDARPQRCGSQNPPPRFGLP